MPRITVAYVDTETTGVSSSSDRIIELAIVVATVDWASGAITRLVGSYQGLQDPLIRIPSQAKAIHGISNAMVKGHRIDPRKAGRLLAKADICLAHNSRFDQGFVAQVIPEASAYEWGCTCWGIPWKRLYPALPSLKLEVLSRFFGCKRGTAHRAMGDVETLMDLVTLPGVHGGRAFQQLLLHRNLAIEGEESNQVALPDPHFLQPLLPAPPKPGSRARVHQP